MVRCFCHITPSLAFGPGMRVGRCPAGLDDFVELVIPELQISWPCSGPIMTGATLRENLGLNRPAEPLRLKQPPSLKRAAASSCADQCAEKAAGALVGGPGRAPALGAFFKTPAAPKRVVEVVIAGVRKTCTIAEHLANLP